MRRVVIRIAETTRWMAGALCVLLSLRFVGVAMAALGQEQSEKLTQETAPVASSVAEARYGRGGARAKLGTAGRSAAPERNKKERPITMVVAVSGVPDRSVVYVNGNEVGAAPFIGDISCWPGELVKLEVVPKRGAVVRHEQPCHQGSIRIVGP